MNYDLLKDIIGLARVFETENANARYPNDLNGFKQWMHDAFQEEVAATEPGWYGKENGRSAESVISTSIVHLYRYAKNYSKSAIHDSEFSTQEDFIYLINLKVLGAMNKTELIKMNVHEKPAGMQIINRLIRQRFIGQSASETDKRSKVIHITEKGLATLEKHMPKISQATKIVTGNLSHHEKMQLIQLLNKLDEFHNPIYKKNMAPSDLLETAFDRIIQN